MMSLRVHTKVGVVRPVPGDERQRLVAVHAVLHEQAHGHRAGATDAGPTVHEDAPTRREAWPRHSSAGPADGSERA